MGKMCQSVGIALVNVDYFSHVWVSILKGILEGKYVLDNTD
jgi:hypothetical protein